MIETIKKTIINIMVTTCAVLLLLPLWIIIQYINKPDTYILYNLFEIQFKFAINTYQILLANIVIHLGLLLTRKFESTYAVFEYLLDISYIILVLIVFGILFKWIYSTPIWVLAIMGVVVYIFNILLNFIRIKKDAKDLNSLLQKRKEKYQNCN